MTRRRGLDLLIVGAVLAVAGVALLDAVGGGSDARRNRDAAAGPLQRLGLSGVLVYTDRRCSLHAVLLPSLRELPPPAESPPVGCEFELSAGGADVAPHGAAWEASRSVATCRNGVVEVVAVAERARRTQFSVPGCLPAWRQAEAGAPRLTVVRDGAIVEVAACTPTAETPSCGRTLVSAAAIRSAAPRGHVRIEDTAWLSPRRVVVLLGVGDDELLAVFEAGRLRRSSPLLDGRGDELVVGSRGTVWAGGADAFAADGSRLRLSGRLGDARAAAWSPDGQWLALATRDGIVFVRPGLTATAATVRVDAADLAWR